MSKPAKEFQVPELEDLTSFFTESFGRDLSPQEQKIMDFFHHQVAQAVLKNMEEARFRLCATMILMLSPKERREYCLSKKSFGDDEKRNGLAKTIGALFLEDIAALDNLIHQSNDELERRVGESFAATAQDRLFAEVGECSAEEKSTMREFCTGYTIFLAKNIYSLFDKEESDKWRLGGLPNLHELSNHPEDRLAILGHLGGVVREVGEVPKQSISNPGGYSLKSRGEKRSLEATF